MTISKYGSNQRHRGRIFVPRVQTPQEEGEDIFNLTEGLITDVSAREIPLGASPDMDNVRFEGTGIRRDFGYEELAGASTSRILGLVEHKYFDGTDKTFVFLVRVYRDISGKALFDAWDGTQWKTGVASTPTIEDVFLSLASMDDVLFLADGTQILQYDETPPNPAKEDNFPSGNSLTALNDSTIVTVVSGEAVTDYIVHFRWSITINDLTLGERPPWVEISFLKNATDLLGTRVFGGYPPGNTRLHETFVIPATDLKDGDTVTMKITAIGPTFEPAEDSFSVHGFNKPTDADPAAGLTYNQVNQPANAFTATGLTGPPAARFIVQFGDRLIAIGGNDGPDQLSWTVDGDPTDWTGVGSGQTFLLDSRTDPLDELMSLGSVASNVLALFRRRSIMRVRESGNIAQAIVIEHWIEGLGTDARFSVEQVADGVMFLGHDLMVYYFNGSVAPLAVGVPVHESIMNDIGVLGVVQDEIDAAYDPVFREYYLSIPRAGKIWIFDLGTFLESRKIRWRRRPITALRLSTVSRR